MSIVKFSTVFYAKKLVEHSEVDQLIMYGRDLRALGVVDEQSGNLSGRTELGFVITCANTRLGYLSRDDFAEVLDLKMREDNQMTVSAIGLHKPSSESPAHWIIYETVPEVKAIFHFHDDRALELAEELGLPMTEQFQISGTHAMLLEIQKFITQHPNEPYFFMRDHGAVVMARTMSEAFEHAENVNEDMRELLAQRKEA